MDPRNNIWDHPVGGKRQRATCALEEGGKKHKPAVRDGGADLPGSDAWVAKIRAKWALEDAERKRAYVAYYGRETELMSYVPSHVLAMRAVEEANGAIERAVRDGDASALERAMLSRSADVGDY
jgi:hypothetical protein